MTYVLGCDISKYQDNDNTPQRPDFQKLKDKGVKFVFIRSSQNVSIDPDFKYNWNAAKDVGLIRGAYHFHEYRDGIAKPTLDQAKFMLECLGDDIGELPPCIDYEQPNSNWPELPARMTGIANLDVWFNFMDKATNKTGIFYTNPNTLLYNLRPNSNAGSFLWKHPLWIAQYLWKLKLDGTPVQPLQQCGYPEELGTRKPYKQGWDRFAFWQFTDRLPGLDYGMESKQLDGDVYNGTMEDMSREFSLNVTTTPVLTFEERLTRLEKMHNL